MVSLESKLQSRLCWRKETQVFPPPGVNTTTTNYTNCPLFIFRLGATGELAIELHSLSGLKEVGCEVTNSKYFSRESTLCNFEIGRNRTLCF